MRQSLGKKNKRKSQKRLIIEILIMIFQPLIEIDITKIKEDLEIEIDIAKTLTDKPFVCKALSQPNYLVWFRIV